MMNDPLTNPDKKFFNDKIDLYEKSMKERVMEIISRRKNPEKKAVEILKLIHDLIQTEREEHKWHLRYTEDKDYYRGKSMGCLTIQHHLRDQKHGGVDF